MGQQRPREHQQQAEMASSSSADPQPLQQQQKQSMVEKHRQKLYDAKYAKASQNLKRKLSREGLRPHGLTRDFALDYAELDVDLASHLISRFAEAEREAGRSLAPPPPPTTREEGGGRSRKHRRRHRHRGGGEDRHHHRGRRSDASPPAATADGAYGKYGVLKSSDIHGDRRTEFMLWVSEVKKADAEMLPKWEEKNLFGEFMDSYNTGTLPSDKYYDLDAWRRRRAAEARDDAGDAGAERVVFNDEEERKRELAQETQLTKSRKIEEARRDLLASGKLSMMREQERLRAAQQVAYKTGDMKKAKDIADILRPDEKDNVEWDVKTGQYRKKSKLNN